MGFLVYYYLAVVHTPRMLNVHGITHQRLMRRVDYITDRWAMHAPWWQLAIWLRQVTLTFVVNLPTITNNLLGIRDEGDDANRPII